MLKLCVGRRDSSGIAVRFAIALAAALSAALAANIALDVVGDFVLAHDAYDDAAHGSRWLASIVIALVAVAALAALTRKALADARGSRGALRVALRSARSTPLVPFVLTVAAATLPLLLGMAGLDATCAGARIDDPADLFGGSLPLGIGIGFAFALAGALGARRLLAFVTEFERTIVRAVAAFVGRSRNAADAPCLGHVSFGHHRARAAAAALRGTRSNRAPPQRMVRALP